MGCGKTGSCSRAGMLALVTTPFQVPHPTWPEQTLSKHLMNGRSVCSLTSWLLAALQAVTVGGEAPLGEERWAVSVYVTG